MEVAISDNLHLEQGKGCGKYTEETEVVMVEQLGDCLTDTDNQIPASPHKKC